MIKTWCVQAKPILGWQMAGVVLDLIFRYYSSWNVQPSEISLPIDAALCQVWCLGLFCCLTGEVWGLLQLFCDSPGAAAVLGTGDKPWLAGSRIWSTLIPRVMGLLFYGSPCAAFPADERILLSALWKKNQKKPNPSGTLGLPLASLGAFWVKPPLEKSPNSFHWENPQNVLAKGGQCRQINSQVVGPCISRDASWII